MHEALPWSCGAGMYGLGRGLGAALLLDDRKAVTFQREPWPCRGIQDEEMQRREIEHRFT